MDIAYDIKKTGDPILLNANKLNIQSISSKSRRFVCIACGEYVAFIHDKDGSKYFRHKDKDNNNAKDCEKRIESGTTTQNYYEIKGSPLYIKEYRDGVYKLYISFSGLGVAFHEHLRKYKASIIICGEANKNKKVNLDGNNFNIDDGTLIEVDFLPSKNSYKFKYEASNKNTQIQLMKKWSDFSDFLSESGALFSIHESGGRKIPKGGFMYSNTSYLYVTNSKIPTYKGLQSVLSGSLKLGYKSYDVYQIIYEESDSSIEDFSIDFCETGLNLIYKSKKPQLIPLWPPYTSINDECNVINNSDLFYFLMKLYDSKSNIFKNTEKSSEMIDLVNINDTSFLSEIPINKYNTSISINSFTNEQEIIVNNREKTKKYIEPQILFTSNSNTDTEILKCGKYYEVQSNVDIKIFSVTNPNSITNLFFRNTNSIFNFPEETKIWVKSNEFTFEIGKVSSDKNYKEDSLITDIDLYRQLKMYENSRIVYFDNINRMISYLRKYPISYTYVKGLANKKKIPIGIQKVLIEIGGEYCGK